MTVDINAKDWHVLTKTRNGTVSMIRNLSLSEARKVCEALNPFSGRVSGQLYHCQDSDIEQRDVLGPDGWDGCLKAPAHDWSNVKEIECDGGPNKGRLYRSGSCVNCSQHQFIWCDDAKAA